MARALMAVHGLIYPDDMLPNPLYAQFLAVPGRVTLPLRSEPDPVANLHMYPQTQVENPPYGWAPYPTGATPDAFLGPPPPNTSLPTASRAAVQTWAQVAGASKTPPILTSMRTVASSSRAGPHRGSIDSDPVGVQTLPYDDM